MARGTADLIIAFEPAEAVRQLPYLRKGGCVVVSTRPVVPVSAMTGGPVYDLENIMSYLRLRTGSVWPCALAHGAINAVASISVLFCTVGLTLLGPNMLGLLAGLPMIAVGIVCWLRMPIADQGDA
jgi:hypothetical protein